MPRRHFFLSQLISDFARDESGFIISAELVLISTVCVLGLIAGLTCVRDAVSGEMNDIVSAFRGLDQSYYYSGFHGCRSCKCGTHSFTAGSSYFQANREREKASFIEIEKNYYREQEAFRKSCQGCEKTPPPVKHHPHPVPVQPVPPPVMPVPVQPAPIPCAPEQVVPQSVAPVPEAQPAPCNTCNSVVPAPFSTSPVLHPASAPCGCGNEDNIWAGHLFFQIAHVDLSLSPLASHRSLNRVSLHEVADRSHFHLLQQWAESSSIPIQLITGRDE